MVKKPIQWTLGQMCAGMTLLAFLLAFLRHPVLWAYNTGSWAYFRAPFSSFFWVFGIEWPYAPIGDLWSSGPPETKGFCLLGGFLVCVVLWLLVIVFGMSLVCLTLGIDIPGAAETEGGLSDD